LLSLAPRVQNFYWWGCPLFVFNNYCHRSYFLFFILFKETMAMAVAPDTPPSPSPTPDEEDELEDGSLVDITVVESCPVNLHGLDKIEKTVEVSNELLFFQLHRYSSTARLTKFDNQRRSVIDGL
jgi:hypothetical protein